MGDATRSLQFIHTTYAERMQAFMYAKGVFGREMKILRDRVYTDYPSEQSQYTHLFCVIVGRTVLCP
jgi:hypothetical protein